jgi:hypothetical protein
MKEYKIIARRDKTEEALGYVKAKSESEAISIAAQIKDLDVDKFIEIFKLKERIK